MGSRDKDPSATTHHQPLLSSLVVRPSDSGGGGGGSDYEPGEVRRDPPPYPRSDRFSEDRGYRTRAGSGSPVRRREVDHRYSPDFDRFGGPPRPREFANGRDPGRYRESSPPYGRGRGGGGRSFGRGFDGPRFGPGPFRGEGIRNTPNVRPREGDWFCPDPACGNLNFARREHCNNCHRFRYGPGGSPPRRGYPGPPPSYGPPRRFPGPPMDRSPPGRLVNGYRSPPRGWNREGPRDFRGGGGGGPPFPRQEGRFLDHPPRRDRLDYPEDEFRERGRFDRPGPPDWAHGDRGRDNFEGDRKGFERRPLSPQLPSPLPPHRGGRWARDRTRSPPIRAGLPPPPPLPLPPPPPKEYRRDTYNELGREDRRAPARDRDVDPY